MWLFIFALPLAIFMIVGGLIAGGIYTIVFLPVALVIIAATVIYTMWGRATAQRNIPGERERVQPLPNNYHSNTAATPSTPEQLVDAQRREQ